MNEQLVALWNRLRRRVDHLAIAALVVLLAATALLYWAEQEARTPTPTEAMGLQAQSTPANWPRVKTKFEHPKDIREVPDFDDLMGFDPFDPRSVEIRAEMVARLDKQFEAAYGAFRRGDLEKAEQICRDIIKQMPSRRDAADLLRQIREQRKKQDAATKSP
ncbi:hypothetical protein AMJ85_01440 [candidate division BRC1 bacterium SM23_51]|nr:MAG: hypothetical protein AMJ85_01440 [candidate division BRC1 bacterium SM23_51]